MNLLVTGGAGFIGSNVIHHLIDRPEISRLVNLDCRTEAEIVAARLLQSGSGLSKKRVQVSGVIGSNFPVSD